MLHIVDQEQQRSDARKQQRSDGGRRPYYAQRCLTYGDYREETLRLSDRSFDCPGRSGVTLRIILPLSVTPLGSLSPSFRLTQGKPPGLSPGPLLLPADHREQRDVQDRGIGYDGGYTQGRVGGIYTRWCIPTIPTRVYIRGYPPYPPVYIGGYLSYPRCT